MFVRRQSAKYTTAKLGQIDMVSVILKTETDLANLTRLLKARVKAGGLPMTVNVLKGAHRSNEQNRLQRLWVKEIAEQLGDQTPEEIRGYCKLTMGVPILRRDDDRFREKYDEAFKPLGYEQKLALMMEPFDFAVTRLMTTAQKTEYLNEIVRHFATQGCVLTQPEAA